jgi:hypothetical protein
MIAAKSTGGANLHPSIENFKVALTEGPIGIAVYADKQFF